MPTVESILAAGLGTLPLAPLAVSPAQAAGSKRRLPKPSPGGLRYSEETAKELLRGVRAMKESVTYQAIIAEGRAEGRAETRLETARELLLNVGSKKLGQPDRKTTRLIVAIDDYERLKRLNERLLDVESWKELLRG